MYKNKTHATGLTLIELLAVLVILVAVAGTLVPLIPDVSRQSHGASGADSIKEITKAITLYQKLNGSYPNNLDSLMDSSDAMLIAHDSNALMNRTEEIDLSTSTTESDAIRAALFNAGISNAYEHDFAADNQTFEGVSGTDALGITDSSTATGSVAALTGMGEADLNLAPSSDPNNNVVRYVVFGLGNQCDAIGNTMIDAPVMFSPDSDPIEDYVRYALIFAVKTNGNLELASVSGIHHMASMRMLAGMGHHLEDYYEANN